MRTSITAIVIACLGWIATAAHAQDIDFRTATERLRSPDRTEVTSAIESLGILGDPRAVGPLSQRIRDGLPEGVLEAAIDTLTVLGRPEAGPVLFDLVSHRRAAVRLRAVQGMGACRPRGADRALSIALGDSNAEVRGAAATAIGDLGAVGAIDSLFLAFDRDVTEAGPALGRIVRPEHVAHLLEYLGRVSFSRMGAVLTPLLARRELPARTRLEVIARLGEIATPEVRSFLEEFVAGSGLAASDPVQRAAQDAIARIR